MGKFKRDILSITLLAGMAALTIVAFTSGATAIAVNCLIITIVTTFTYLLITFLQDKTHLYNIPYNIPHDKKTTHLPHRRQPHYHHQKPHRATHGSTHSSTLPQPTLPHLHRISHSHPHHHRHPPLPQKNKKRN